MRHAGSSFGRSHSAMRSACLRPCLVSSRAMSSLPPGSSASACLHKMSSMTPPIENRGQTTVFRGAENRGLSPVLLRPGLGNNAAPGGGGERDTRKDERDPHDMEEVDALVEEQPAQQAAECRHQVNEDAGDVRPDLMDGAIPEYVTDEGWEDSHVRHRRDRA